MKRRDQEIRFLLSPIKGQYNTNFLYQNKSWERLYQDKGSWSARYLYLRAHYCQMVLQNNLKSFLIFLGFPHVTIVTTDRTSIIILCLVVFLTYTIPISISCAIFISLICKNKRLSNNRAK